MHEPLGAPAPGAAASEPSPPSALSNTCYKWDIVPHAPRGALSESTGRDSTQGSPCPPATNSAATSGAAAQTATAPMLPTPTRQESPRSTVNSGHFDDVTAAPAHHVCDIAATPSKCSPRAANASPKASPETPVPSASKRAADAPPTPATEERNTKRQRVPSTKFRAESPSPPPAQRKRVSPNKKSSSSKTPVPSKPTIMPTIFHTDKAALREFRRQNDCTSREAKIAAALQALAENGCIVLHFGDKAHQDYIRSKGATLSIGGKLVSQIQLKREHWEEVIDSLNFALSGQGCRKDGHGLGKNARAFFNYCSVLPKRDHKYRDWNDLTWSFDEANVADIQNVKIWQRGYQKRRREEKRMEEGGSVSDVDDKCVAKVREEPPEEAKKPKARAPKAASEAAKVAPAMPSREDVSALMTLHQACLLASKAEQAMLEASCAS